MQRIRSCEYEEYSTCTMLCFNKNSCSKSIKNWPSKCLDIIWLYKLLSFTRFHLSKKIFFRLRIWSQYLWIKGFILLMNMLFHLVLRNVGFYAYLLQFARSILLVRVKLKLYVILKKISLTYKNDFPHCIEQSMWSYSLILLILSIFSFFYDT